MELKIKEILALNIEIKNALTATQKIISELEKRELDDRIVLLRVRGELEKGKISDIKFQDIDEIVKKKGAYFLLKNTHELNVKELEMEMEIKNAENIEEETIRIYSEQNPSEFNKIISEIINFLSLEKLEDERTEMFTNRVLDGARKILKF